jgi:hypothetical protein
MHHNSLNIPTSIIISGVESNTYWDIVVNKCEMKTVLMSYHYLQGKPKGFLADRMKKYELESDLISGQKKYSVSILIDSGAHTFFQSDEWGEKEESFWDDYLTKYTAFVRDNKDYIFACANLDIEGLVGIDKVNEWNQKYFKPLEDEGIQVCYIWHAERGNSGWEDYCDKHSYIGISMENDTVTVQQLMRYLTIAKKTNTRVHGMALTKTEIMVRVPFFSCDSTTWLVGQQYGELNWFNGRKMQRLSKQEWQRMYKTKLLKEPFNADWDRLINGMGGRGDTYELLRLNVIAYRLAEEHIRDRLKSKMYWMQTGYSSSKPEKELRSIEDIELPEKEWYFGEADGYQKYLSELEIDPQSFSKDEAVNILYFFYMFLKNDSDALDEIEDEVLINYAKQLLGGSIDNRDDAIEGLREYYIGNATGERNDFREEEVESNAPQERQKYVEEDAFAVIDLSEEQIFRNNSTLLPPPKPDDMPEVTAYDEELKNHGITITRDSTGRFIKGQQKVRKPKNVYSDLYPKLACNTCYKSGDCPQYKAGFVCAFDKMFKRFDSRNLEDVVESMQGMANFNMERLQRAMLFETLDGGMPTPEVTGLIDQNIRIMEKMKELIDHTPKAVLEQRRILKADGSEETTTTMNVNPTSGGILSQIFGADDSKKKKPSKNDDIIDA